MKRESTRHVRALYGVLLCGAGLSAACSSEGPARAVVPAPLQGSAGSAAVASGGSAGSATASPPGSDGPGVGTPVLVPPAGEQGAAPGGTDAGQPPAAEPDAGAVSRCEPVPNPGSPTDGDANVDVSAELQRIAGFGGMDGGFYPELTPAQVDTAFGAGPGQVGLSIIRIRIPEAQARFGTSVAAAARAAQLGATVMATPWSPPANLKSNGSTVGGSLNVASYGAYADHLLAFRDFMLDNGVPLYAISVQNEPDIAVDYESCDWTAAQLIDWIRAHGARFGETKLMAPESFNFNRSLSDPILNDEQAAAQVDIIGGHVYGNGLFDYPLAREKGKEVWMTEHYTDSANPANAWPLALEVAVDVHRSMAANFSAYVWWAIRRAYGLLTEDGVVSKRGHVMAQYSRFIRPDYVRVAASQPSAADVLVTAYKPGPALPEAGQRLVIVAINQSPQPQTINLDVFNGCATSLSRFTTSATKNVAEEAPLALSGGRTAVTLDGESVTTFVSE